MMAKQAKHLHRYKRLKYPTGKILYKCMVPGCTHSVVRGILKGRTAQCWKCSNPLIIGKRQMRQAYIRCDNCSTSIEPDIDLVTELLGD